MLNEAIPNFRAATESTKGFDDAVDGAMSVVVPSPFMMDAEDSDVVEFVVGVNHREGEGEC